MANPFRRELRTGIEIEVPPWDLWNILVDFERYPEWTGLFEFPLGHTDAGKRLRVRIFSRESKYMTFEPMLLRARAPEEFRWKGRLLMRGIFDGEHLFRIVDKGRGDVRFEHSEIFSGFLVPWLWRDLDTNTRRVFERFNEDLKRRAEGVAVHER